MKRTRSEKGDGATEENARLEGWPEKQRVSTTCRSDIKPALQPCRNHRKPREVNGLITRTGPLGTNKEGREYVITRSTGYTDGNRSGTG